MAGKTDKEIIADSRKVARSVLNPAMPPGALGNTMGRGPDFDKAVLPSDSTRPNFRKGGKIGKGKKRR